MYLMDDTFYAETWLNKSVLPDWTKGSCLLYQGDPLLLILGMILRLVCSISSIKILGCLNLCFLCDYVIVLNSQNQIINFNRTYISWINMFVSVFWGRIMILEWIYKRPKRKFRENLRSSWRNESKGWIGKLSCK